MAYTLVLDDDGKSKCNEAGHPIFTQPGGTEFPLDLAGLYDAVRQKNGEAAAARKEKEALAARLAAFEGLDPERVREARDAVREKERVIQDLLVKNAFAESAYLREKTVLPPDFAFASLGRNFFVEYRDGLPVIAAKDDTGKVLLSEDDPTAYAPPEEAIRLLIENHPQRDALLRAPAPNGGSGAQPRNGGARSITRVVRRSEFERLSPQDKAAKLKDGWNVVD